MNEDFVTFEIAKKLKEKGFPQHITDDAYIIDNDGEEEYDIGERLPIPLVPDYVDDIAAPTISQALKWLREEKNIHIQVLFACPPNRWEYVTIRTTNCEIRGMQASFVSYELAAIAGIKYVIDNLI